MLVSIRDVRTSKKDRQWIQDVYGEYIDSLADLNTGLFPVIGSGGPREDEIFANWFATEQSHPLIISQGAQSVGFALVTRPRATANADSPATFRMSEFFVRKQHRGGGIGRDAATLIFDRFTGEWEIIEYQRHPGSIEFWRRVLARYCPSGFAEHTRHGEVRHRFKSRASPSR